jgi:hypothetical protein
MAKIVSKPDSEGHKRRRIAAILDQKDIIAGSIVEMVHTCGKAACHCVDGDKHISPYLAVRRNGKRAMISIPRSVEVDIRQAVDSYKELIALVDAISSRCVNDFISKKKRGA